jgi:RNA polymerase sigma factor (sigma-70 family)
MPILPFGRKPSPRSAALSPREQGEAAFKAAHAALYPRARRFTRNYVGELWADDVLQEAFVSLWNFCYRDGRIPGGDVDDLLYRLLRRKIADWLERLKATAARDEDDVLDLTARLTNQTDATRVAEESLLAARIEYLAAALPQQMRRAHELRFEGRDYPDIAAELRTSEATARWNVHEARRRISKQLVKDGYAMPSLPREPRKEEIGHE